MISIHIEIERWKYNKKYQLYVSSRGRIKDCNKKLILPKINSSGYLEYNNLRIHRLVMETFKPIDELMTVDHIDHNKRNNSLNNLEWVSREENQKRADRDIALPTLEECQYILDNSYSPIKFEELGKKIKINQNQLRKRLMKTLKGPQYRLKYCGKTIQIIKPEVA